MDPKFVTTFLFAALIAFAIYRRVRHNIGRQPVSPVRMQWRIGILGVVGALILATSLRDMNLFGAMAAGLAGGVVLAWLGLRHTKFENTPQGHFYTPHTYIGLIVSVLLIARVMYRLVVVYPAAQSASQTSANPLNVYQTPMTLAILGVVVGYYVAYYLGVLAKSRSMPPPAADGTLR